MRAGSPLLRGAGWALAGVLVVLTTRWLVYALAPQPSLAGSRLEQAAGGPRLVVVAVVSLALATALSTFVVWLAALGVRERALLAAEPLLRLPRVRPARVLASAVCLWFVTCLAFALFESYLHWRMGMGWHGLHCLLGPVHRDAIPLLAATSLVAAAAHAAAVHVLAWLRRTVAILACPGRLARPQPLLALVPHKPSLQRRPLATPARQPRAPPTSACW
jgi:hypothetical protein